MLYITQKIEENSNQLEFSCRTPIGVRSQKYQKTREICGKTDLKNKITLKKQQLTLNLFKKYK